MDKKKIKKLLQDADICFLGYERNGCRDLVSMGLQKLNEAQEELSKSDWVSVEDGLPGYDEIVNVRIMILNEEIRYGSSARWKNKKSYLDYDSNGFAVFCRSMVITHWKPIEKLEE